MKNALKKSMSALLAIALLMSSIGYSFAAGDKSVSITFDEILDTAYTLVGGATLVDGRDKKALKTDGTSAYAHITDTTGVASITGDFTFGVWCYPNDDKQWTRVYDIGTGVDKYIFLAPSNSFAPGCPRFAIKNNGIEQSITSSKPLTIKEWNYVAVTRSAGLTTMYVNGVETATSTEITINPSDIGATAKNYLGKSNYDVDPYFNGMIDDFAVYTSALTATQIQELASESYSREVIDVVSKYDRLLIETQFTNSKKEKIFNASASDSVTATVTIQNYKITDATVTASLYVGDTQIAVSGETAISVAGKKEISLNATIPSGSNNLQVRVMDMSTKQEYDAGYLAVASVTFPPASPPDTDDTTYGAHDPTIFRDPKTGKYWVYSTHNLIFESEDLINWTKHDYINTITIPPKSKQFIQNNYANTTPNETYWAPDILYVENDEYPYWLYISISCGLGYRNSIITLLKCKSPGIFDGEYTEEVVLASKQNDAYFTNAIDANLYTDTDGKKYFIWGSFWKGIYAVPLLDNGRLEGVNYTSDATLLSSCQNFGKSLFAVPKGVYGPEGPFMITNEDAGYRYLFTSYGHLGSNYNTRIARTPISKSMSTVLGTSPSTQFVDHNGETVGDTYAGQEDKSYFRGYKMIGTYKLGDGLTYYANAHNSAFRDVDGEWYFVHHSKKAPDYPGNLHVRKMLWTEDGWPVVSPMVYAGEKVQAIDKTMLYGTWDLASVGHTIFKEGTTDISTGKSIDADLPVSSSSVMLLPNGKLGDGLGTWSFDGNYTVTLKFTVDGDEQKNQYFKKGDTMTMYTLTGYDKDKRESALVMTGVDEKHITQFARKANASCSETAPKKQATTAISLPKSTGSNPILGFDDMGNTLYGGDPAATVVGDTVYLYVGHDTSTGNSYSMPEWVVYTSKDMQNWEYENIVMRASDISWAKDGVSAWASQMVEHSGKYYLYFCTWDKTDGGKQSIGVAVSDSPKGPFIDIGKPLVSGSMTTPESSAWNDIDPTVLVETVDGVEKRYLSWGNGKLYITELNEDMISIKDTNEDSVINMSDIKTIKIQNMGSDVFTEGPWLYKRGDTYYNFFAANWREKISYATAKDPFGTWEYEGEIMPPTATSNTNHPSVIDFNGKTYFIYHNGALSSGSGYRRSVCVEEMSFDENGRVLPITETSTGLGGVRSTLSTVNGDYIGHEEFINPSDDNSYPLTRQLVSSTAERGYSTAWEISKSQAGEVISVVGKQIRVYSESANTVVYGAKYEDGILKNVSMFKTPKSGVSEFTASFDVDKVYVWSADGVPYDSWSKISTMTDAYVVLQAVDKPGLFITEKDGALVLTQNADGTLSNNMRFRTVSGLSGEDNTVSFESVSSPGRYITAMNGRIFLSFGTSKDVCTFRIGEASAMPEVTAPPRPTPTPTPDLTPDITNNFDSETVRTLIVMGTSDQDPNTSVNGLSAYVGARSGGDGATVSVAVESGGVSGNAVVLNSGKYVSGGRGPRVALKTPVLIENSTIECTVSVKLTGNNELRINDSVSSDSATDITSKLTANAWNTLKIVIDNSDGEVVRSVYVNDTLAMPADAVETLPVIWGTTANDTSTKVLLDDLSIVTKQK